jgi:lecithin:cholesterol acyltransferase
MSRRSIAGGSRDLVGGGRRMARQDLVIVVVPGGMGTTLSLKSVRVWDFDPPVHFEGARMIVDPALLVPWLPLKQGHLLSVYDDLKKFFVKHGYVKDDNLFLWGYDWRLGMEINARVLADFVENEIDLTQRKLLFVAHSSGCMIVRWALLSPSSPAPLIDNALVERVVAAGPPMLGMARPFKDLVRMPRLNDTFDKLYAFVKAAWPKLANSVSVPINKSLMSVTAQLEGLTPNNIPMLSGGSGGAGGAFGVFDWAGWPDELATLRADVQATQSKLQATPWGNVDCTIIASQSHWTETGYFLDSHDEYLHDWTPDAGDDSVLLMSAQAYCPWVQPLLVKERHRTLLDDPATRDYLETII